MPGTLRHPFPTVLLGLIDGRKDRIDQDGLGEVGVGVTRIYLHRKNHYTQVDANLWCHNSRTATGRHGVPKVSPRRVIPLYQMLRWAAPWFNRGSPIFKTRRSAIFRPDCDMRHMLATQSL